MKKKLYNTERLNEVQRKSNTSNNKEGFTRTKTHLRTTEEARKIIKYAHGLRSFTFSLYYYNIFSCVYARIIFFITFSYGTITNGTINSSSM